MEFNNNKCNSSNLTEPTISHGIQDASTSKLISAITEFIPAFFSPNGVLFTENERKNKPNALEAIIQSEDFFKNHPNSYQNDESKIAFVINKLSGVARRWGLSLLTDGTFKKNLEFDKFRKLLLENFDVGEERKQKYVTMEKLWNLRQNQLGNIADYTIEFRKLAARLRWPDSVLIDIIGKGLIDKVREELDKVKKPETLFDATNVIIGIDKKCYLESCLRQKSFNNKNGGRNKSFNRKRHELNKTTNHLSGNQSPQQEPQYYLSKNTTGP